MKHASNTQRPQVFCELTKGRIVRSSRRAGGWLLALIVVCGVAASASAATYTVDSSDDGPDANVGDGLCATADGGCTFRAALEEAGSDGTADVIEFALGASGSVKRIEIGSPLPTIDRPLTVRGRSQGGAAYEGPPLVVLDGSRAGSGASGLVVQHQAARIEGLVIVGFPGNGIVLSGGTLVGSYIGIDADGVTPRPNRGEGVAASNNAKIGSEDAEIRPCRGDCNIIAGNRGSGVTLSNQNVKLLNNHIGVGVDGRIPVGNGRYGVYVPISSVSTPVDHTVGRPGNGNIVAFNAFAGVGVEAEPQRIPRRIFVQGNELHGNGRLALDLGNDGVTPNDADDGDAGANDLLNWPVVDEVSVTPACGLTVRGIAPAGATVDIYLSGPADSSRDAYRWIAQRTEGSPEDAASGIRTIREDGVDVSGAAFEFSFSVAVEQLRARALLLTATLANVGTSELSPPYRAGASGNPRVTIERCALGLSATSDDSDGDGIPDIDELGDAPWPLDTDGDGLIDALDADDDNDGILTSIERQAASGTDPDPDGDGLPAWRDLDSDDDGIADAIEFARDGDADVDGDGAPSFLDPDTDGDGLCDGLAPGDASICQGSEDANRNGVVDPGETSPVLADTDADGVCDGPRSASGCSSGPDNCPLVPNPAQENSGGSPLGDACDCGDGLVADNEQCDDGNDDDGDGCTASCERMPGFECSGSPSVCTCSDVEACGRRCFSDEDGDGATGTEQIVSADRSCREFDTNGREWKPVNDGDCDDSDPLNKPGGVERCDGQDNDCDGLVDDDDPDIAQADPTRTGADRRRHYVDADNDGCGVPGTGRYYCAAPAEGYALNALDIDDSDGICCGNGVIEGDEECDLSAIGGAQCPSGTIGTRICKNREFVGSCRLYDAAETCSTESVCYYDADGDGLAATPIPVAPGSVCSEQTDGNGNPLKDHPDEDCNDDPSDRCAAVSFPGGREICDGCDNDCDPSTPDGLDDPAFDGALALGQACDGPDRDQCPDGEWICDGVGVSCSDDTNEKVEVCDDEGLDEDCNGLANDDDPAIQEYGENAGATQFFIDADADGCGIATDESFFSCDPGDRPGFARNADDLNDQDGVCCALDAFKDDPRCAGTVTCGNGQIDPGETCDPAEGSVPNCRLNCTFCGDGVLQPSAGENCEIAGPDASDDCREDCSFCGDGVIQDRWDEECDDGNTSVEACPCDEPECQVCGPTCTKVAGRACEEPGGGDGSARDDGGCSASGGMSDHRRAWLMIVVACGLVVLRRTRRRVANRRFADNQREEQ